MSAQRPTNRIAIIGAGPIGLEAALRCSLQGYDVSVFERGQVGENVRDWGHVKLFSPFEMNSSPAGRTAVAAARGADFLPKKNELLTGTKFNDLYLGPLSQLEPIVDCIHETTRVLSIGRTWLHKGDSIGLSARQSDGFELLVEQDGAEQSVTANAVLDCSGSYPNHRLIGCGGQGCPGESQLPEDTYRLADIAGAKRDQFAGRRTLVVGSGYSAATAIVSLGQLFETNAGTRVTWLTRNANAEPIRRVPGDSLKERDRIAAAANSLAGHPGVNRLQAHRVIRIDVGLPTVVTVESRAGRQTQHHVDNIVAHPGFRPDTSLYRELQIHECYASEGPIKLAAVLFGESSDDCLVQPNSGPETLCNPEPGFYVLGSKSYGRNSRFLIRAGLKQIDDLMPLLAKQLDAE